MSGDIKQCSRCSGLIARDHSAQQDVGDGYFETLFVCVHCRCGIYALWKRVGGLEELDCAIPYDGRFEPNCFRRLVADIERINGRTIDLEAIAA